VKNDFEQAITFVFGFEGGFSNISTDPGNWTGGVVGVGLCKGTNFGISASAYPSLDIANLTQAQAEAIYKGDYWEPMNCDVLPTPLALVAFDSAVNSGNKKATMFLQAAAGLVQDGAFGPVTLGRLTSPEASAAPQELAKEALVRRLVFLAALPTFKDFGLGWIRRVIALASLV
jgi:lysozyme family protein